MFDEYLDRWSLVPDGSPIITRSSRLLPVCVAGAPAILKLAVEPEERWGAGLMVWWEGKGAVPVLAHDAHALLLERAGGPASLAEMACNGRDDEATRIICGVVATLHQPREKPTPALLPLPDWFRALFPAAAQHGGILQQAATTAQTLLATPQEVVVLHGDIHHGNILDAGDRGWLAIDPKRLVGERGFDYANLFCNPTAEIATAPGRLARQATVVAAAAGLERERLLKWVLAYAALSAAWSHEDGEDPHLALTVAGLAAAELANSALETNLG
jgi:streptomycin 6-kinase